ncbi:unnamed protein product [Spirodela intermedia]|uniref:Uncharacterized protein n=1 Tax=Spirodela intermedia TaxID=51605 RepID=A0A7I8JZU3_SPIIN|nr:unnamed protein product [Spirodela intermedia]
MEWVQQDGPPPGISEEIADSEQWSAGAAEIPDGGGDDDDDDAASSNWDEVGAPDRGGDSGGGGRGDERGDLPPMSWRAWLMKNATGCRCREEEGDGGEDDEVASENPATETEDRLFWEACLDS